MDEKAIEKVHMKIMIPAVNEFPSEEAKKWVKRVYHQARVKVDWRQANKIKEGLPIETADYVEKMTFGLWRLMGPPPGRPAKESPFNILLECLKQYVIKDKWGQFRREFTRHFKPSFMAVHNSYYLPSMVKDRNDHINNLVNGYIREGICPFSASGSSSRLGRDSAVASHIDFVLHPETLKSYNAPKYLELRNRIWEQYTGKGFDLSLYPQVTTPIPNRPCQMEMHLDIRVSLI